MDRIGYLLKVSQKSLSIWQRYKTEAIFFKTQKPIYHPTHNVKEIFSQYNRTSVDGFSWSIEDPTCETVTR